MTAGALGSLVVYRWMLHKSWADEPHLRKGMDWLEAHWKPRVSHWQCYYLYGLERAGMLYGSDRIGSHEWYDEGADWLIDHQNGDGSWGRSVLDTSFAILFLRRSTAPLPSVATGGGSSHPPAVEDR